VLGFHAGGNPRLDARKPDSPRRALERLDTASS
jgi:hypothetical protein